jgi:hypothetical protein
MISEAEFRAQVMDLCAELGLTVVYFPDSRRVNVRGWPDLVILGPRGACFAELKNPYRSLSPSQRRMGSLITRAGLAWTFWRPADLADGTIRRQLERIST